MSRYIWITRIIQGLFILVTAAVLFVILYPFNEYRVKTTNPIKVYLSTAGEVSASDAYQWMSQHLKLENASKEDADLLVVRDGLAFTEELDPGIRGKIILLERLFSQVSSSSYRINALNNITGVSYSGYSGITIKNLEDRMVVPSIVIDRYEAASGEPWEYYGEGIILGNGSEIVVLQKGIDYLGNLVLVSGKDRIPYRGFFEVTSSYNPSEADFHIDLTNSGAEMFMKRGIPDSFPALYRIERNMFRGYYLAGDFGGFQVDVPAVNELLPSLLKNKLLYEDETNEEFFWRWYHPWFQRLAESEGSQKLAGKKMVSLVPTVGEAFFTTDERHIYLNREGEITPFFIKGVNLGAALPGKFFTEFPEDKETYLNWFTKISALNVNTVRVYTLLPPAFYQALFEFNLDRDRPIYLLQEIWPEEQPEDHDYLKEEYNRIYRQEIDYAVHAVHGNILIPERKFRAYGFYTYDVSPYLLGYLVGRELEPEEVLVTDELHPGYIFDGKYVYTPVGASPTEGWLAASCDYALSVEMETYGRKPLTAIVSWPTLDPLEHDSEWNLAGDKSLQYNDKAVVDIDHIQINKENTSGFFGAYHIYPNYPNFMNNETVFAAYKDARGAFRYGGYLEAFIAQHNRYPAVVAEYGLSTSLVTAHYNPDGLNHGGLSENQQAGGIIRMTDAILNEGYAGAVIFEWMDEWAKKTWTTENYMIPYDRHVFWHNTMDPEQNYGLLAMEAGPVLMEPIFNRGENPDNSIVSISAGRNESYLLLEITLDRPFLQINEPIQAAIDTFKNSPATTEIPEFALILSENPRLLANPGYNWTAGRYKAHPAAIEEYEELIQLVNPENISRDGTITPELWQNLSELRTGPLEKSINHIEFKGNTIRVRLPYTLLGISDPSSATVLADSREFVPTGIDQIGTDTIDSINFLVSIGNNSNAEAVLSLVPWETPVFVEREKESFKILSEYFQTIP